MAQPVCRACGEVIDVSEFLDPEDSTIPAADLADAATSGYCLTCYTELKLGAIPMVTDSSLPAPGTGLVYRQKMKQRQTDGG